MSKQTVTYCYCDICQKEGAKNYNALAYRTFSETDSSCRYDKPVFQTVNIDLCDECAGRITALHGIGVYGEKYEVKPIDGGTERSHE